MSLTFIIVIIALGLILLALEIVALPGGIAGICGGGLVVWGIIEGYVQLGTHGGNILLLCSAVACVILIGILIKSKTWKRFSLNEESDSAVNQVDDRAVTVGTRGTTIARLAPTGKALIDGELVEVHAVNKFIDPDKPIEVVAVEGYRIDVVEIEDKRFDQI